MGVASVVSSVTAVKREECDLIRTLANTHYLLAEVSISVLTKDTLMCYLQRYYCRSYV